MVGELMQVMLVLVCFLFIGFTTAKIGVLNKHANQVLAKLILYITLPSLIIFSLYIPFSFEMIKQFNWLLFMSFYILGISIIVAAWTGKRLKVEKQRPVYESLIIFGNQGFIGYAIIYALFEQDGVVYLAVFNIIYLILIWTYGIYLFNKSKGMFHYKRFINPGLLATFIGVILFLLPVKLPIFIVEVLEEIGKMTIPLSMIFIGSLFASERLKALLKLSKNIFIWKAIILKLIVIPVLILPFILLSVPTHLVLIAMIVSGMPSASTVSLYAEEYHADSLFAATGVFISTILCMVTIPFLVFLFHLLITLRLIQ